jgi:dihydroxyacid dehydratase/phosphogluconate dehydratase
LLDRRRLKATGEIAMKMHAPSFNDPIINQAEPITLILPFMMEILRFAGIKTTRDEVVRRLMTGSPRIAIIHGGEDHPAQVLDERFVKKGVRSLWMRNALPFPMADPGVCDGIAQGHIGMSYVLLSRNLASLNVITQCEAHGYQGALVLTSCDKRPAGEVTGLVQVDLARRRKGMKPFYAVFLPTHLMPDRYIPAYLKRELIKIQGRVEDPSIKKEISDLLKMKMKCNSYAMYQKLIDTLIAERRIDERKGDYLKSEIVKYCCIESGTCAFTSLGTGCTSKLVVAGLGLVPSGMELPEHPHIQAQVDSAVEILLKMFKRGDSGKSVSSLVRQNLKNAIVVWSAIGGSTNWALHFPYVAASLGIRLTPRQMARVGAKTPLLMGSDAIRNKDVLTLTKEISKGDSSGIDTLMKVLFRMNLVKDADTVQGRWLKRVRDAKEANNQILHASPLRNRSGVVEIHGNFCRSAIFKLAGLAEEAIQSFNDKIYFAIFYQGQEAVQKDLLEGRTILRKLRQRLSTEDLLKTLSYNFPESLQEENGLEKLSKDSLFDRLVRERKIRILVVITGEGPRAHGMPEMFYPSEYLNRDLLLRYIAVLFTDGRYSGATYGPCIGHCSPEAFEGGGIGAIETGDWVYLNFDRSEINLVDRKRLLSRKEIKYPFLRMSEREILSRPWIKRRVKEIGGKRKELTPWAEGYLDSLLSTESGVRPNI